jgi:hypothetical protein
MRFVLDTECKYHSRQKFAARSPEHKSLEKALEKIHSTLQSRRACRCKSQQLSAAKFVSVRTTQIRAGFSHESRKPVSIQMKKRLAQHHPAECRSVQQLLLCVCLTYKLDEIVIQHREERPT